MSVQLNHTIVWCKNQRVSAHFLTALLGLPPAAPAGPMLVVELANGVSLDYYDDTDGFSSQHYAFMVDEADFEPVLARIRNQGLPHWADPGKQRSGEIYHFAGNRGVYVDDPDGHLLEVIAPDAAG